MRSNRCNFCGRERFEERRTEYLYSHDGRYLIVPDAPVSVCLSRGAVYYEVSVLKEIERRFFAVQEHSEQPDRYIEVAETAYR